MARTLMAPVSGASDWSELWEDWESWFRNLAETHALAPILAFVPTVRRGQTWLAAAAVGLGQDPAEMQVHTFDPSGKPAPRSFHIACFRDQ